MDIVQTFYNRLAPKYDKLFLDWDAAKTEQAQFLHGIFQKEGFDVAARILDCACGIGTQAIGLSLCGYCVTASDVSGGALEEAEKRAAERQAVLSFCPADFRFLSNRFSETFDIVIAMDNALPHMLTREDLSLAVASITQRMAPGGLFVAGMRDYDTLLSEQPPYAPPYIHKTPKGQRVAFQTWEWEGDVYQLVQYIIEDEETCKIDKFTCKYRAVQREELTTLLLENGCSRVEWRLPEDSGFYQPIVLARK